MDETFPDRAKQAGSGFIVGGHNYGQGASREQAALAPRYLGVRVVIAKSFARIHLANLINFGILPLVFVNEDSFGHLNQGDSLLLDTATLSSAAKYKLVNQTNGSEVLVESPLSQEELNYVKVGGRLNWIKMRNR